MSGDEEGNRKPWGIKQLWGPITATGGDVGNRVVWPDDWTEAFIVMQVMRGRGKV